jgi:hypothetical protein
LNSRPHESQLEDPKAKKTQECHLDEGKPQKSANDTKSSKAKQNDKEELGKAQKSKKRSNQSKSSKSEEKLKINTPLKSTPPNTLNTSSPA